MILIFQLFLIPFQSQIQSQPLRDQDQSPPPHQSQIRAICGFVRKVNINIAYSRNFSFHGLMNGDYKMNSDYIEW